MRNKSQNQVRQKIPEKVAESYSSRHCISKKEISQDVLSTIPTLGMWIYSPTLFAKNVSLFIIIISNDAYTEAQHLPEHL
ncbi:hypothetical protein [Legionella sainthelensi]|uniref:hypothetical protein n=1 Tax=Legionella sainthelensi TaxID=28087 RepID=UPI000484476C|nr:hypothetical protein [Legionella sainthelensi]